MAFKDVQNSLKVASAAPGTINDPLNRPVANRDFIVQDLTNFPVPNRPAVVKREVMTWLVQNRGSVEMYLNPQSLSIDENKRITETRTKGGFVVQYWGEELPKLKINGTTGSSGVEGINILRSVYRAEQVEFAKILNAREAYLFDTFTDTFSSFRQSAATVLDLAAPGFRENISDLQNAVGSTIDGFGRVTDSFSSGTGTLDTLNRVGSALSDLSGNISSVEDLLLALGRERNRTSVELVPTLGALATSMEMYYHGEIYRGFFTNFSVTENTTNLGLFDYNISFTVTRRYGRRENFMSWHRAANAGHANSETVPLSFGSMAR